MRRLINPTVLALVAALVVALPAPSAAAGTTPHLLDPTGRYAVGVTTLHLVDTSRPDPWVPSAGARELMVSVFYPAARAAGPTKQYLTPTESRAVLAEAGITDVPPDVFSTVRTNAVVDAPPVGRRHGLPLVVLSPGFKRPRATLSSIAEDLASHGAVVAVLDHTYENVATTFPDGRVTDCAACGHYDPEFWAKLTTGRAADVSFVIDQLTGPRPPWRGAHRIDRSAIAMVGQSVGGASAVPAMLADPRILAGMDVDGLIDTTIPDPGLDRPFLLLGRADNFTPGVPDTGAQTWERVWPGLTGWKRWLVVDGMSHASFTDLGLLASQVGVDLGAEVGGARGTTITRAYVRAFVDRHLRGQRQPLLDRPAPRFPEVELVRSGGCR